MPGGRPTKYTDKFIKLAESYLNNYHSKYDHIIPSIAGLSEVANIARDTLHTWRKEAGKEAFSDILDKLLAKQERILLNNGLTGEFNSNITKLALGKHGYSDKLEQYIKGSFNVNIDSKDAGTL